RVDRDFRAHPPRRVRERFLGSHRCELVARVPAERPAGAGENERGDLLRRASLEAREERRVLTVDGQDAAVAAPLRGERELTGRNEALLVREREVDTALERPQRRVNAG